MKSLLLASFILLISCNPQGDDSKKKDHSREQEEVVCACLPITEVTIKSQLPLPTNIKVLIYDFPVYDECREHPSIPVLKTENILKFTFSPVVTNSLKFEVVDLGENCDNDALFFQDEDVPFKRKVISTRRDKPRLEAVSVEI
jgi:hypothetical protein